MSDGPRVAELVRRNAVFFVATLAFAPVSLLLLDEPSLGLAPLVVKQIFDAIARRRRGPAFGDRRGESGVSWHERGNRPELRQER